MCDCCLLSGFETDMFLHDLMEKKNMFISARNIVELIRMFSGTVWSRKYEVEGTKFGCTWFDIF
jgi:hypothetical protein